jgi:cobalamin biosynthesis protein cobU, putative, truncation
MILIYAGAYQGKLDFARKSFGIKEEDICYCNSDMESIDFGKKVIYGLEKFIYGYEKRGQSADEYIRAQLPLMNDKIIICEDISRGLVPMDKLERAWRETNGRVVNAVAAEADEVYTVFCGIESRIK